MGARFVAAIIGVIILVVLAQTFVFSGDDDAPSLDRPDSIPTATPPADLNDPVLLGENDAAGGGNGGSAGGSGASTYTVQSGDTLSGIAAQLGVPAEEQAAWIAEVLALNGMEDARQLQAGQELTLPGVSAAAPAPTEAPQDDPGPVSSPIVSATGTIPTPTPPGGVSSGIYVVESGDYPYLIATKHCVDNPDSWSDELLELNGVDATSLTPGQELQLPPGTPALCQEGATSDDAG